MKPILLRLTLGLLLTLLAAEGILQLASLYTHWKYQREIPILQPSTIRVLCLGDSNVYGLYLPKEDSWPSQLQTLLDAQHPGRYQVINLGFPGTQTFRILESLPDMLAATQPDQVLFLAGVNDLLFGTSALQPTPSWADRLQTYWRQHIHLYRLFKIMQANRHPGVSNRHDDHFKALQSLGTLTGTEAKATLASLYDSILAATPGLGITLDDNRFSLDYKDASIDLNPVLSDIQRHSGDIHAMYKAHLMPLVDLYELTGLKPQSNDVLSFNNARFELSPISGDTHNTKELIKHNILSAQSVSHKANARFYVLSYASKQHFYGVANRIFRSMAKASTIALLDLEPAISAQCHTADCPVLFFPDQHPTAKGYALMAEQIAQYLLARDEPVQPPES